MSEARSVEPLRVLLVGATGLIGRTIIARSPQLSGIVLQGLARREIPFAPGTRMELVLAEADQWPGIITVLRPDAVISALGTTHKKAGSNEAFRAVDHDLVLEVARAARAAEVQNFVQISTVGADPYAKSSYMRVKGETEKDLKALKFHRLDVLRPSLLRGRRQNDIRPLETMGQVLAPLADLFLHGERRKYRSIRAQVVAAAALGAATARPSGQFVHEHESLVRLAREFDREQASFRTGEHAHVG